MEEEQDAEENPKFQREINNIIIENQAMPTEGEPSVNCWTTHNFTYGTYCGTNYNYIGVDGNFIRWNPPSNPIPTALPDGNCENDVCQLEEEDWS